MAPEPRHSFLTHLGSKRALVERTLPLTHLGKRGVDALEDVAHGAMDLHEQRPSGGLFLGLGEHPARRVCLDRAASEFAGGNTFLAAHFLKLLHAASWHQILLAQQRLCFGVHRYNGSVKRVQGTLYILHMCRLIHKYTTLRKQALTPLGLISMRS